MPMSLPSFRILALLALLTTASHARGDQPPSPGTAEASNGGEADASAAATDASDPAVRAEVEAALRPVADLISRSQTSRTTVELTSRSILGERSAPGESAVFQIASQAPNRFSIQLKSEGQVLRVISDGERTTASLGQTGYFETAAAESLAEAVTAMPIPLGPYPGPLLALALAGGDPIAALLSESRRVEVANHEPLEGVPAVELRGVQDDDVSWKLWLATAEDEPRPLRMTVDLTPVVAANNDAPLPAEFAFEIEFRFRSWRMGGEIDEALFKFEPSEKAKKFESLEDYFEAMLAAASRHPLVGQMAPDFSAQRLDGKEFELSAERGKVVVLDFWATWCGPCVEAMPVITEVTQSLADSGVLMYAVNIGEQPEKIQDFLARLELEVPVLLDPEGKIGDAYAAEAIPQTVLIGKDGRIEVVHIGMSGPEAFKQELTEQLRKLIDGEPIAEVEETE